MAEVAVGNVDGVLAEVRELAQALIAPGAAGIDRESQFPDEQLSALARVGALGLMVPCEQAGVGAGLVALAAVCEAVGGACASTGMVFVMHSVTAATVAGGGGPSAARLLEDMASGEVLGTLAFSERGTGAHFYAPELRAERRDGSVFVSGRKSFVTSGGHADAMLVLLQGHDDGLDCYVVGKDAPGVRFEGRWEGLGMRGNSSIAVEFEGVLLDGDALIGEAGGGAGSGIRCCRADVSGGVGCSECRDRAGGAVVRARARQVPALSGWQCAGGGRDGSARAGGYGHRRPRRPRAIAGGGAAR